jgi:hypothetical protein
LPKVIVLSLPPPVMAFEPSPPVTTLPLPVSVMLLLPLPRSVWTPPPGGGLPRDGVSETGVIVTEPLPD